MSKAYAFLIQNEFIPRQTLHKLDITMKEISQKNNIAFEDVMEIKLSIIQNTRVGRYGHCTHGLFYPIIHSEVYDIMDRFALVKRQLDNPFVEATRKESLLRVFSIIQRMYRGFSKLAQVYRYKQATLQVSHDMYWSPMEETNRNVMMILCHGSRYLFKLCDIVKLFISAITNMEYNIANPLPLKNPYTNKYFKISTLYNMYFFIRSRLCQVPILIQNFFMTEFNITKYSAIHKTMIQDVALEQSAKYTDSDTVYNDIMDMIDYYNTGKRTYIDPRFPKHIMVKTFRPYLVFYYKSKYSRNVEMNMRNDVILENQLDYFFLANPRFGEVHATGALDGVSIFNTTYANSCVMYSNAPRQYLESHIYPRDQGIDTDTDTDTDTGTGTGTGTGMDNIDRAEESAQSPMFSATMNTRTSVLHMRTDNYHDDEDTDDTEDMNVDRLSTPTSPDTDSDIDNIYNADMRTNSHK